MTTHLYNIDITITLGIEVIKLMQLILKILAHYL